MPKPLIPLSVQSPGFMGLNTQNSGGVLPTGWATKLENFVYDNIGRLASRKGYQNVNASAISGTPTIQSQHEYIDASGNSLHIFAAGNKIFKNVGGTITDISGTITTPTADNWQFANFNGSCVGYQEGHNPIVLTTVAGSFADAGGTMYDGNMVLSAGGRTWTVFNNTLYYSDLLIHNYTGGSSGSFDLSLYWPNGMDEAVALAEFNGFLVVFGKESIIIYANFDDPASSMSIVEGIDGIGCIARDSVQNIGKRLLFLSSTGVRSLGRVIQEKSTPLGDVSQHVRDAVLDAATNETSEIKSVYNRVDWFYLLSFPSRGVSYYFDLKFPNQDQTLKATTWALAPYSLLYTDSLDMYMGFDDGFINIYQGYSDNKSYDSTASTEYSVDYEGVWNDFGDQVSSLIKIPKKGSVLAAGVQGGILTLKWAFDYMDQWSQKSLQFNDVTTSQYGISQYGIDTYSGSIEFERVQGPLSKSGQVMKLGLQAPVKDTQFALQRIDVLAKIGRIGI